MKLDTLYFDNNYWIEQATHIRDKTQADIVFLFGHSDHINSSAAFNSLRDIYPRSQIIGASSSGNIFGAEISTMGLTATAVFLEKGSVAVAKVDFSAGVDAELLSQQLMDQLPKKGLKHVVVLSDGLNINGSALVRGINNTLNRVPVSGGMAGDGDRFLETWVVANEPASQFRVVAVGFYGEDLVISTGYNSGWSSFGPERTVTRSHNNILYEIDNKPALQLYKEYLGEYARELPLSGMRFPLNIKAQADDLEVTRTLLAIDEAENSITFAGDIPEGYIVRLMKPNMNDLITGAGLAAERINKANDETALGLVVSCVGRKVVMNQLIEEELEEMAESLGLNVQLCGFYSYGEFAPFQDELLQCQLHNQTITLTAIYEK